MEQFNRTLLQTICCYIDRNQKNWDKHPYFTPNMLMQGSEVYQPQDIWLGVDERGHDEKEPPEYVHELEKSLGEVHELARKHLHAAQH